MKKARLVVAVVLAAALIAGLFQIGFAAGGNERVLTKVKFIHYHKMPAKPPWAGGGGKPGGKEEGYYTYLSKGAQWRVLEDWYVDTTNGEGLSSAFILESVGQAMGEWEIYGGTIFGDVYEAPGIGYSEDLDGYNTVSFGPYGDPQVIAVTTVWGYFGGPPPSREIVEADVLFNEAFEWGDADIDATLMDLVNIAVHEIGHCAGMGDIYEPAGSLESMYGYSTEGETIKRDLYTGDITGITKLYQ